MIINILKTKFSRKNLPLKYTTQIYCAAHPTRIRIFAALPNLFNSVDFLQVPSTPGIGALTVNHYPLTIKKNGPQQTRPHSLQNH